MSRLSFLFSRIHIILSFLVSRVDTTILLDQEQEGGGRSNRVKAITAVWLKPESRLLEHRPQEPAGGSEDQPKQPKIPLTGAFRLVRWLDTESAKWSLRFLNSFGPSPPHINRDKCEIPLKTILFNVIHTSPPPPHRSTRISSSGQYMLYFVSVPTHTIRDPIPNLTGSRRSPNLCTALKNESWPGTPLQHFFKCTLNALRTVIFPATSYPPLCTRFDRKRLLPIHNIKRIDENRRVASTSSDSFGHGSRCTLRFNMEQN